MVVVVVPLLVGKVLVVNDGQFVLFIVLYM